MLPIRLALTLVVLLPATANAAPNSLPDYQRVATQAAPHSPCAGKLHIEFSDTLPGGAAGHANGLEVENGRWTLRDCVVSVNRVFWRESGPASRCDLWVHEALHYATLPGRDASLPIHAEGTMLDEELQEWPACHDPMERATDRVLSMLPEGWSVSCAKRKTLIACRAENGHRTRRYVLRGARLKRVR